LGKLKIRCDHRERGCDEVLSLENLTQHSLSCKYNLENSNKCKKANDEMNALKKKSEPIKAETYNRNVSARINALKKNFELAAAKNGNQNISARMEDSISRELRELKLKNVAILGQVKDSNLEKENSLRTRQEVSDTPNFKIKAYRTSDVICPLFWRNNFYLGNKREQVI